MFSVLRDGLAGAQNSDLLCPLGPRRLFPEGAVFLRAHGGTVELGATVGRSAHGSAFRLDDHRKRSAMSSSPAHPNAPRCGGFPEVAPETRAIDALQYEPIFTCYLRYSEATALPAPMLGLPGPISQWVFDRGQLSGPPGLLAVVISASGAHEEVAQEELAARIHQELKAVLPALPQPLWSRVIGEKRATFSCRPALLRPRTVTAVAGLLLAGDYAASDYPGTLESAVRSGIAAAGAIGPVMA